MGTEAEKALELHLLLDKGIETTHAGPNSVEKSHWILGHLPLTHPKSSKSSLSHIRKSQPKERPFQFYNNGVIYLSILIYLSS